MNFERFCIELTGIKDPLAAKKITLLFMASWFFMLMVSYLTVTYIDALGAELVRTLNKGVNYIPGPYPPDALDL